MREVIRDIIKLRLTFSQDYSLLIYFKVILTVLLSDNSNNDKVSQF